MPVTRKSGRSGFAFVELLIVITLLGIAGTATVAVVHATVVRARLAEGTGRKASVAMQLIGQIRAGLTTADSGAIQLQSSGENFEATYIHRDSQLAGAIEIRVMSDSRDGTFVLDAPQLSP